MSNSFDTTTHTFSSVTTNTNTDTTGSSVGGIHHHQRQHRKNPLISSSQSTKYLQILDNDDDRETMMPSPSISMASNNTDRDGYEIPILGVNMRTNKLVNGSKQLIDKQPGQQRSNGGCDKRHGKRRGLKGSKSGRNYSPPPTYSQIFSSANPQPSGRHSVASEPECDSNNSKTSGYSSFGSAIVCNGPSTSDQWKL